MKPHRRLSFIHMSKEDSIRRQKSRLNMTVSECSEAQAEESVRPPEAGEEKTQYISERDLMEMLQLQEQVSAGLKTPAGKQEPQQPILSSQLHTEDRERQLLANGWKQGGDIPQEIGISAQMPSKAAEGYANFDFVSSAPHHDKSPERTINFFNQRVETTESKFEPGSAEAFLGKGERSDFRSPNAADKTEAELLFEPRIAPVIEEHDEIEEEAPIYQESQNPHGASEPSENAQQPPEMSQKTESLRSQQSGQSQDRHPSNADEKSKGTDAPSQIDEPPALNFVLKPQMTIKSRKSIRLVQDEEVRSNITVDEPDVTARVIKQKTRVPKSIHDDEERKSDEKSEELVNQQLQFEYPDGFTAEDDLNNDGIIDNLEQQIKISQRKDFIFDQLDLKVRQTYLRKFRKEVDFHHKVAYRFERAYRLSRKEPAKKEELNQDIFDIISEHSDYIEQDPSALFYCLYFCIFYNNDVIVDFLKVLVKKSRMKISSKFDLLLQLVDENGLERLRSIGESVNTMVYHIVLYQSIDDRLRVVYSQVIRQLKAVMLRDKDASFLLKTRDYQLIEVSFDKYIAKVNLATAPFFQKQNQIACTYRKYSPAYYEEILIEFKLDRRVAQNYRERFVVTPQQVFMTLQMYVRQDFLEQFLKNDLSGISRKQMLDLFHSCIKHDSFKIGLQIYLRYLHQHDITQQTMRILTYSLKESNIFQEVKLCLIHDHFDLFDIEQLNKLIDTLLEVFRRKVYKLNPMMSQYNTIKYSLLVYRVSWRISQRNIYSLITKCQTLNQYIETSLDDYLKRQAHISQLYRLMKEPIFSVSEKFDSFDIILQMNMSSLLNHPVIIEVLNLVNEGQYSVDSPNLYLSQTLLCFFNLDTFDLKSVAARLASNIKSFGEQGNEKQFSLQFHVWKHCIDQRMQDEMLFTVLFCFLFIVSSLFIQDSFSNLIAVMYDSFGQSIFHTGHLLINAKESILEEFCPDFIDELLVYHRRIHIHQVLSIFTIVGLITQICQKVLILKVRSNVELSIGVLFIELCSIFSCLSFAIRVGGIKSNSLGADICAQVESIDDSDRKAISHAHALMDPSRSHFNVSVIVSLQLVSLTMLAISQLQKAPSFGQIILMFNSMVGQLMYFIATFGTLVGAFIIVGRLINEEIHHKEHTLYQVVIDIFDGLNASLRYDGLKPFGEAYMLLFSLLSSIVLLATMTTMFVIKSFHISRSIEAINRLNIIKLKNSISYDRLYGSATISFFPINVLLFPFFLPLMMCNSTRFSDLVLKAQYALLIVFYGILGFVVSIAIVPLLAIKIFLNQAYILVKNKRQKQKLQDILLFLFSGVSPILILGSLLTDFINLPRLLMRKEKTFEFKYQQSLDHFTEVKTEEILDVFKRIFVKDFAKNYRNHEMSLVNLQLMHRKKFELTEHLHDLFCCGSKNYKQALSNMQKYNLTKYLSQHASIPDPQGQHKESMCDFNTVHNVLEDIYMFNYVNMLYSHYYTGTLSRLDDAQAKNHEEDHFAVKKELRKMSDLANNLFIDIVALSFTTIPEDIKQFLGDKRERKKKDLVRQFKKLRPEWLLSMKEEFSSKIEQYEKVMKIRKDRVEEIRARRVLKKAVTKTLHLPKQSPSKRMSHAVQPIAQLDL